MSIAARALSGLLFSGACLIGNAGCGSGGRTQSGMDGIEAARDASERHADAASDSSEPPASGTRDAGSSHGGSSSDGGTGSKTKDAAVGDAGGAANDSATPSMDGSAAIDAGGAAKDSAAPSVDGSAATADAGDSNADAASEASDAETTDSEEPLSRIAGWSVRKRLRTSAGADALLEEQLTDLASAIPKPSRIVLIANNAASAAPTWTVPEGMYISDFCAHPSGAISVISIGSGGSVSLARLDEHLALIATATIHDPDIANDPNAGATGVTDLVAKQLTLDPARIGSVGDDVVAVVFSSLNSVIAYRASFAGGAWSLPQRTLLEPPVSLTPNLPIGGSFDTFGAMTAWFRCSLDVDESGNTYVAVWANSKRISEHVKLFDDALASLPGDPNAPTTQHSDVLLTKIDTHGVRLWSRVVGTMHEDEPYALRAQHGSVAVVGRSRRLPGFDNTFWDTFIAVTTSDGADAQARALEFDALSIALAVDSLPNGGWVLGGSDGWTQNPSGLSILTFGAKLLVELPSFGATPVRIPLPAGPRHNEIRTLSIVGPHIFFGGHEDGPLTHSGDGDVSQIHATGVLGSIDP